MASYRERNKEKLRAYYREYMRKYRADLKLKASENFD